MKRQLCIFEIPVILPEDIVVHIARCSNWAMAGSIMRSSKDFLRLFMKKDLLGQILEYLKSTETPLFSWLSFLLPCPLLSDVKMEFITIDEEALLYKGETTRDISVLQYEKNKQGNVVNQSPLSLYSYFHDEIVCLVPETFKVPIVSIGVLIPQVYIGFIEEKVSIWSCIKEHQEKHLIEKDTEHGDNKAKEEEEEIEPFFDCPRCQCNQLIGSINTTEHILKWRLRLSRITKKLPEAKLTYCKVL